MTKEDKPMLSIKGQIDHLISKGVLFQRISLDEAEKYLEVNNNYFKLCAYRKNFFKHPDGVRKGEYINLDFALLKDLSIIDMRLRYTLMQMSLDVEHFAKVNLLKIVDASDNDGYQIVSSYFENLKLTTDDSGSDRYNRLKSEIRRNKNNSYCGGIIQKYDDCFPIWAFIEIIPLGTLIDFYGYCAKELKNKELKNNYYLLLTVKELRNACAHNNCVIHEMGTKDQKHDPDYGMLRRLDRISKSTRDNQLMNERMRQIVTLLYTHTVLVKSDGVNKRTKDSLANLVARMYRNIDFYKGNGNILAGFDFLSKVVSINIENVLKNIKH